MELFLILYSVLSIGAALVVFCLHLEGLLSGILQELTKAQIIFRVFICGPFTWILAIGLLIDKALSKVGTEQKKALTRRTGFDML